MNYPRFYPVLLFLLLGTTTARAAAVDLLGRAGIGSRHFVHSHESQNSAYLQPEWYWSDSGSTNALTLELFLQADDIDEERSRLDVRELFWLHVAESWELRLGVNKVFWGVAESNHLVDIINQTDQVEQLDGEEKLGQPMTQLSFFGAWGTLDTFILPYFRERTFPAAGSRLGRAMPILEEALYEADERQRHIDYALRYSHFISNFDFGVSLFKGTAREPQLVSRLSESGQIQFQPYYYQLTQLGLDLQATVGAWLWKLEAVHRSDISGDHRAYTAGFEYTFFDVGERGVDVGLLLELSRDGRPGFVLNQNDLFLGARLAFNDAQDSQILFGASSDLDYEGTHYGMLEASRRLGGSLRLAVDGWFFRSDTPVEPTYFYRNETFVDFKLEFFF